MYNRSSFKSHISHSYENAYQLNCRHWTVLQGLYLLSPWTLRERFHKSTYLYTLVERVPEILHMHNIAYYRYENWICGVSQYQQFILGEKNNPKTKETFLGLDFKGDHLLSHNARLPCLFCLGIAVDRILVLLIPGYIHLFVCVFCTVSLLKIIKAGRLITISTLTCYDIGM